MTDDARWFERPRRTEKCQRCRGCGTIEVPYALTHVSSLEVGGAPSDAIQAFVVGSPCRACWDRRVQNVNYPQH